MSGVKPWRNLHLGGTILRALGGQWGATLLVALMAMGVNLVLARLMGPSDFGRYQVLLTLAGLLGILQEGGFATLLFREHTAPTPDLGAGRSLAGLALGRLLGTTTLLLMVWYFWPAPVDDALPLAILAMGVSAWHRFNSGILRGQGRWVDDGLWQVSNRLFISVGLLLGVWFQPESMAGLFLGWGVGGVLAMALPWGRPLWVRPRWQGGGHVFRATLAMVIIDLATTLYFRADLLWMRLLEMNPTEVGLYAAAYRLVEAPLLLFAPIGLLGFRYLRTRWNQRHGFHGGLLMLSAFGGVVAALLAFLGHWFNQPILELMYGPTYQEGGPLFSWLLLMLVFALPNTILTQAALASNHEWGYAAVALCCALFNLAGNVWLLPRHGVIAAAWCSVATEGMLMLGLALLLRGVSTRNII